MERRLVLFLDGMDEVPTGLKSMLEAYVMCYLRTYARVVTNPHPHPHPHPIPTPTPTPTPTPNPYPTVPYP